MTKPTHIHHINFLVRDLESAVQRHELLGLGPFEYAELAPRQVRTARTRVGQSWLVLVQPIDQASAPAQHLAQHGEGFFLLSFGVDDLTATMKELTNNGVNVNPASTRQGLLNWHVVDLPIGQTDGALLQLTEERNDD